MEIRNCEIAIYNSVEVEITKTASGQYKLIYRGIQKPDNAFILSEKAPNVFIRYVNENQIRFGFQVQTFALYNRYKFQVDKFENGRLRISTSDNEAYEKLKLHFVDRGWYDVWVELKEIEKMWEERSPSGYGFPFPGEILRIKEIFID